MVSVMGCISRLKMKRNWNGERFALALFEDHHSALELLIFSDVFSAYRDRLQLDQPMVIEAEVKQNQHTGQLRLIAQRMHSIEAMRERFANYLWLHLTWETEQFSDRLLELSEILKAHAGSCRIVIDRTLPQGNMAHLLLGDAWRIRPSDILLSRLKQLLNPNAVCLRYTQFYQKASEQAA